MKIISIIPARGGSKGLPKKNIKSFAGKPLISYTIECAIESKQFNKIIVSTESSEIAEISKKYNVEIIKRPMSLAQDDSSIIPVIYHVMDQLEQEFNESTIIVLLQPTSPLRIAEDIKFSIKKFFENECESLISVVEVLHPPHWFLKVNNGFLKPLLGKENLKRKRQDFEKIYLPNGAIFIAKFETLKKYNSFFSSSTIPYVMPFERSIDIDVEIDFILAELLYRKKRNGG